MEFTYKCDSTALDFIGTLKARETGPVELLVGPTDVATWLREAGVVDDPLDIGPADLEAAIALREAVWAAVASRLDGSQLPADALATINSAAAEPAPVPQLEADGRRVSATPAQALSAVARDAIAVLSGRADGVMKQCSRHECTQVYLDRSRGARREWCSMQSCGNRMKARDYRARKAAV